MALEVSSELVAVAAAVVVYIPCILTIILFYCCVLHIGAVVFGRLYFLFLSFSFVVFFRTFVLLFSSSSFIYIESRNAPQRRAAATKPNQFNHVFINLPCEGQTKIQYINSKKKKRFSKYIYTHTPPIHSCVVVVLFLTLPVERLPICVNENETSRVMRADRKYVVCVSVYEIVQFIVCVQRRRWHVIRAPTNKDNLCEHDRLHWNRFQKLFMQSVFSDCFL